MAELFGAPGIRFILGAAMRPALNAPRRQPTSSVKILLETLGIPRLNEMQSLSIPRIRAATNLLIVAPTGSGKTEAALLPILEALAAGTEAGIRALYEDMLNRAWSDARSRGEKLPDAMQKDIPPTVPGQQ